MKEAWESLGDEFAGSSSVVIGDVDCTVEADLCSKHGVSGYPTIKYWKDGATESYNGGRDLDSLKRHVETNLVALCKVNAPGDCSEQEVAFINKVKGESTDSLNKQLERLNGMKDAKVKPDLKRWINQRIAILTQLTA